MGGILGGSTNFVMSGIWRWWYFDVDLSSLPTVLRLGVLWQFIDSWKLKC